MIFSYSINQHQTNNYLILFANTFIIYVKKKKNSR